MRPCCSATRVPASRIRVNRSIVLPMPSAMGVTGTGPIAASASAAMSSGKGSGLPSIVIRSAAPGIRASISATKSRRSTRLAAEVELVRAAQVAAAGLDQRAGHVVGVLEQGPAGEADRRRAPQDGGHDGLGGGARHALVAARAVHRHRPQPDARHPVLGPVDAGRPLVGLLVDAVVVARVGGRVVLQPVRPRVRVRRVEHADRPGVDDLADALRAAAARPRRCSPCPAR